ncbi:MAG: peptidoglycan-binding domain-containing protein [Candidatus Binatus sp.]|uniref:peptidoglycan-binding domain-containing protein n=1 Tax=Candidatus Binatus sp. TaxID=2811406 RepID=UPI00271F4CF1|nr:peptidoglycan-binding protein [Candidatus Binatus sp.]MDO8434197.1 peptidoglycan-binding domain-containing protein [Candidatus Binatus sp.]
MRPLSLTRPHMRGSDVVRWQQFLDSRGFYDGSIDGDFGEETEEATEVYQKESWLKVTGIVDPATIERAIRDGFSPPSDSSRRPHYTIEADIELTSEARSFMENLAERYYLETGMDLTVTSGTRTARSQAEAMYTNMRNGQDPRNLYSNYEAADEIWTAYNHQQTTGASRYDAVDAITRVIEGQVSRGVLISQHLRARAVDVRNRTMTSEQRDTFERLARDAGARASRENEHRDHIIMYSFDDRNHLAIKCLAFAISVASVVFAAIQPVTAIEDSLHCSPKVLYRGDTLTVDLPEPHGGLDFAIMHIDTFLISFEPNAGGKYPDTIAPVIPDPEFARMKQIKILTTSARGSLWNSWGWNSPHTLKPPQLIFTKSGSYEVLMGTPRGPEFEEFDGCWVTYFDYPKPNYSAKNPTN